MKNKVPWNWIITSFVFAVFGLVTYGVLCNSARGGNDNNLVDLQVTIKGKNEYISSLQDTLELKNKEISLLQQKLNKREKGNSPNNNIDKATINSLNGKIREKERIIRDKDAEIKRLRDKIEFINSL